MTAMVDPYVPRDQLSLWYLGDPAQPRIVGEIALQHGARGVSLRYAAQWLQSGFALSEDLPLVADLFVAREKDTAAGSVDDARPDRWGERVIRKFEASQRMSLLEYLLFAGDDRYGALGVSQSPDAYEPWKRTPMPMLESLAEMAEVVRKVLANETVPELQRRLVRPGASLGGARPKSLIEIDREPWIVKFPEGEELDMPLIEHATMLLATQCGIDAAPTRALKVRDQHAVAVRRFDRAGARRLHAVSANVALRAAGESEMSYLHFSQLLRRVAAADRIGSEQRQLFKRMVFNILVDNTDDHEKNHALLRQADGTYRLSPAFDVVPSAQGLGYQQMIVGDQGSESSLSNALSQSRQFGLDRQSATKIVREISTSVARWKEHFAGCGVADRDLEVLAQYIDGTRLRGQRQEFLSATGGSSL